MQSGKATRRKRRAARKRPPYKRPHPGRGGVTVTPSMREEAQRLAYQGSTQAEIAAELGMALQTAREHLLTEMHEGKRLMLGRCRRKALDIALGGSKGMLRFILSHQDPEFKRRFALENPDGTGLFHETLKQVPTEHLEQMDKWLGKAEAEAETKR